MELIKTIRGLAELWRETTGDGRICIAVLDAPVDLAHPCFVGARVEQAPGFREDNCSMHGTEVASILFARHESSIWGIAPDCRGLSIPIFGCGGDEGVRTSQQNLAQGIHEALDAGACVINVSAGQFALDNRADASLVEAVRKCAAKRSLLVAATGNDGCDCLHFPAALPTVLSVGAMGADGHPLAISNWGTEYRTQGILAPGELVPVASSDQLPRVRTGTSYATAIVTGVAALLLSRQLQRGQCSDPLIVRQALLESADRCNASLQDCRRFLMGSLNIPRAIRLLDQWSHVMSDDSSLDVPSSHPHETDRLGVGSSSNRASVTKMQVGHGPQGPQPANHSLMSQNEIVSGALSASSCAACQGERELVYALGQVGYDFGSEACLDAFKQRMQHAAIQMEACSEEGTRRIEPNPLDEAQLIGFLRSMRTQGEPWHTASLMWTLSLSGMPLYVLRPEGPFAREVLERLEQFFTEQFEGQAERIAVPGWITGQATLLSGQSVPAINPDLRGLCNWRVAALEEAVLGGKGERQGTLDPEQQSASLRGFLDRIYFELRNAGRTAAERALNYAGTNLFEYRRILSTLREKTALDTIRVEPSTLCRPHSDCWDITLAFFDPNQPLQTVRTIYRYTIDVSDVIPVTVGEMRSWSARIA